MLLETFKTHSRSDGGNFVVGTGYGSILALRLASTFTRNSVGGLLLLSCPPANSKSWHPQGGSGSGPAWFEGAANVVARLFASSWPHGPNYVGPCLMHYLWPRLLRQHVEARYSSSAALARGRFGAATVEAAVRRAFEMGPLSHVARCARCVRPFHLRDDFFATVQLVTTMCVVGEEAYASSGGTIDPASGASVCAALGLGASRLVVVPNSGRQCVEEQPQAVADVLVGLVTEADKKRAAFGLKDGNRRERQHAAPTLNSSNKKETDADGELRTASGELFDPDDFATF